MSNKSKRFSVGGLFSKSTPPTKEKEGSVAKKRENSHLIKSRGGKRLTVYLPEGPVSEEQGPIDDRRTRSFELQSKPKISASVSPLEEQSGPVTADAVSTRPVNTQRQASNESVSSSVYPNMSRNATMSSSIYPQTPSVGLSAANTISRNKPQNPYEETPYRRQSSRNPTLLRKRKPPPLALNVITDSSENVAEEKVKDPSPISATNEYIKSVDRELEKLPNPSTDAIGSLNESHYSPLKLKSLEIDEMNSPLSFVPINIETVDAPVRALPPSPIGNKEDHDTSGKQNDTALTVTAEQYDDYVSDSDESKNIPKIRMHVPSVRETLAQSPEFEISKEFSMHSTVVPASHKHSRTVSSVEDITNAIDSFQLSHPMLEEEQEDSALTDHDNSSSFQRERERELDLSRQLSPQEEKDLEEGGLYLRVADLPELEEGQSLEEYVENLEKEIAGNKISNQSSPLKLSVPPSALSTPTLQNEFSKPSSVGFTQSEHSSTSDVFYEAQEAPAQGGNVGVGALKLAYDDLVDDDDDEMDENEGEREDDQYEQDDESAQDYSETIGSHTVEQQLFQSVEPEIPASEQENSPGEKHFNHEDFDQYSHEMVSMDVPPPYMSMPPSPQEAVPEQRRRLNLDREIENTITEPEQESDQDGRMDDFYPDAGSDLDDGDNDDEDDVLEFKAAKSPISDKFDFLGEGRRPPWQEKTPESYECKSYGSIGETPDRVEEQNMSQLIVINGTPDSVRNRSISEQESPLQAPSLPLLPSQTSLDRELSDKTITTVRDDPVEFPIYDRREEPSVSPIQHTTVVMPVAPLLKKPLIGKRRPVPDYPNGGRRSRGLSMTTANPELFTKKEIGNSSGSESDRAGKGQRSAYVEKLRSNGKSVNVGKLNTSMLPVSLRRVDNNIVKKTASNATLLFGASKPRTRILASEMDDSELPDATQLHSGKTKIPVHPDAEMIATNEEFRKMAEEEHEKSRSRRRSSASILAPQVQRLRLFVANPDSD